MKKPLAHTKCTVKLRKSEYHNEWKLYILKLHWLDLANFDDNTCK